MSTALTSISKKARSLSRVLKILYFHPFRHCVKNANTKKIVGGARKKRKRIFPQHFSIHKQIFSLNSKGRKVFSARRMCACVVGLCGGRWATGWKTSENAKHFFYSVRTRRWFFCAKKLEMFFRRAGEFGGRERALGGWLVSAKNLWYVCNGVVYI